MTIYYTYKLTHIITGQVYFGYRQTKLQTPYLDLGIVYFSSSKVIKMAGFENFFYGVVSIYDNRDECYWAEQELIKEVLYSGNCINKFYQRQRDKSMIFLPTPDTDATRLKKSMSAKGKPKPWKRGIPISAELKLKQNAGRKRNFETWSIDKKEKKSSAISDALRNKPKNYTTLCAKKFICRLSDRKEFSKASAGKYLTYLKPYF